MPVLALLGGRRGGPWGPSERSVSPRPQSRSVGAGALGPRRRLAAGSGSPLEALRWERREASQSARRTLPARPVGAPGWRRRFGAQHRVPSQGPEPGARARGRGAVRG
ncbi:unnamed protein product [Gadus morhua 'NCC']